MTNTDSQFKAKLATSEDWEAWNHDFQSKAVAYRLWDYINPDADEAPLITQPSYPKYTDLRRATAPQTTGTSTTTSTSTEMATPTTVPSTGDMAQAQQVEGTVTAFVDLTPDEQRSYQSLVTEYSIRSRHFDTQQANLQELRTWMRDTVAVRYRVNYLKPTDSLRQCYSKLRDRLKPTGFMAETIAKDEYLKAVKPLTRPPRSFRNWLENWVMAVEKAKTHDIQMATKPSMWYPDFINAIHQVKESWATGHETANKRRILAEEMTFDQVANDFENEIRREEIRNKGKATKGSFGPTFGEQDTADQSDRASIASSSGKRKRTTIQCVVCERKHCWGPKNCYYADPSQAPKSWRPNPIVMERAKSNLEQKSVQDQLKKIRKRQKSEKEGNDKPEENEEKD